MKLKDYCKRIRQMNNEKVHGQQLQLLMDESPKVKTKILHCEELSQYIIMGQPIYWVVYTKNLEYTPETSPGDRDILTEEEQDHLGNNYEDIIKAIHEDEGVKWYEE